MSDYNKIYIQYIQDALKTIIEIKTTIQDYEGTYIINGKPVFIYVSDHDMKLPENINGDLIVIGNNHSDMLSNTQTCVTGNVLLLGSGIEVNIIAKGDHVLIKNISYEPSYKPHKITTPTEGAVENKIFIMSNNQNCKISISSVNDKLYAFYKTEFSGTIEAYQNNVYFSDAFNNGTIRTSGDVEFTLGASNNGTVYTYGSVKLFSSSPNNGTIYAAGNVECSDQSSNYATIYASGNVAFKQSSSNYGTIRADGNIEFSNESHNNAVIYTQTNTNFKWSSINFGLVNSGNNTNFKWNSHNKGIINAGGDIQFYIESNNFGTLYPEKKMSLDIMSNNGGIIDRMLSQGK